MVVKVNMQGPPGAFVRLAHQLYVAEQPSKEDLTAQFDFELAAVPEQKVAYTFHKGRLEDAQRTFMRLWQWTIAQGLDVIGYPTMVVNGVTDQDPEVVEVQLPIK